MCAISLLDQSENTLMVPKPNYDFPLSQAKIWNSLPLEAQSEAKTISQFKSKYFIQEAHRKYWIYSILYIRSFNRT